MRLPGAKIVVEAKRRDSYSLAQAREEIETARKNRGADWGVFVFSKKTAPPAISNRSPATAAISSSSGTPKIQSTDVFLKAGIIAARALCFRTERQSAAQQVDFEIDRQSDSRNRKAGRQSRRCSQIGRDDQIVERKSWNAVRIDREALEKQVEILRQKVKEPPRDHVHDGLVAGESC